MQLVISGAHTGLQAGIRQVLQGTSWQRCRGHWMRNLLVHVPKHAQTMVSALGRTIFAQPDQAKARGELGRVADSLEERLPTAAALLAETQAAILAFVGFPSEHWKPRASTKPLQRLNRAMGRWAAVVGSFLNRAGTLRLVEAVLMEYRDEWATFPRRHFSPTSAEKLQAAWTRRKHGKTPRGNWRRRWSGSRSLSFLLCARGRIRIGVEGWAEKTLPHACTESCTLRGPVRLRS